jgi:hypothetical protein
MPKKGLRKHLKGFKDKFSDIPEINLDSPVSPRSPREGRSIAHSLDIVQVTPDFRLTSSTISLPHANHGYYSDPVSPRTFLSVSQTRPRSKRTAGILDVKEALPFFNPATMEKSLSSSNIYSSAENDCAQTKRNNTFPFACYKK